MIYQFYNHLFSLYFYVFLSGFSQIFEEKPLNFLKILLVVTLKTMPLGIIPGCGLCGLASSVQGYKSTSEEKKK